jgi:hypothetical protein
MILTIGKDFTTDWSVYSSMQVRPGKPRCPGLARRRVAAAVTEFPTLAHCGGQSAVSIMY